MSTEKTSKNSKTYSCDVCSFYSNNKNDLTRHCSTRKHKNNIVTIETFETDSINQLHYCDTCDKVYGERSGLWRHKKKCMKKEDNPPISTDAILEIVKQNQEFKNLLIEQNTKIMEQNQQIMELTKTNVNTMTINNTNSNNTNTNSFNLNFFLNEQCKNAINLVDFIASLQVSVKNLEQTGKLGYVEGFNC